MVYDDDYPLQPGDEQDLKQVQSPNPPVQDTGSDKDADDATDNSGNNNTNAGNTGNTGNSGSGR